MPSAYDQQKTTLDRHADVTMRSSQLLRLQDIYLMRMIERDADGSDQ